MSSPVLVMTDTAFQQKQKLIENLVNTESSSVSEGIKHARVDIRQLSAEAQYLFEQGDIQTAVEVQQNAFDRAVKLRRLLVNIKSDENSLEKFKAMLEVCSDYIAMLRAENQFEAELTTLESELNVLGKYATNKAWEEHWNQLESIHNVLILNVSRVLDNQERVVSLNLDTPQEQFEYELKVYDGMVLLLTEYQDGLNSAAIQQIEKKLSEVSTMKVRALKLYNDQQYTQAIEVIENANLVLKNAMRIIGINLP